MNEDSNKPESSDGKEAAPGMTEDELRAELEKHFREQTVSDFVVQFMVTLTNLAYMKMGLTEDTQDIKDLDQASMAIDGFKALLDNVGKRLPPQEFSALAGALSSMQLTFVKASSPEAGGGGSGGESSGGGSGPESSGGGGGSPGGESGSGGAGEEGKKPEGDDPASRLWVPGKE